jgi:hypothetical protein
MTGFARSRQALSRSCRVTAAGVLLCIPLQLLAQEPAPEPKQDGAEQKRDIGLPAPDKLHWRFNFDASWGTFGFGNSLYANNRPDPSGNLSGNWFEGSMKPALSASYDLGGSELYGTVSFVGERTYGAAPTLVDESASSFKQEDLFIGWRSGTSAGASKDLLDVTLGRAPYTIGHGLLIWDGGGEGGSRGGFWTNARKAWKYAAVGRVKPGNHTFEGFWVARDDVPENEAKNSVAGANYEYAWGGHSTFGVSYLKASADPLILPDRDGMNVFHGRAYTAPIPGLRELSFEFEYAREKNRERMRSTAWSLLGAYEFGQAPWKPRLSYRYAFFEGDHGDTPANEAFDPLFLGFYDWGTWWQGEIAGEYFLSNSNNISHQVRLHLEPSEALGWGVIGYVFRLDRPETFGEGVTSRDVAFELDAYADWKFSAHFTLSLIGAFADPRKAVEQGYDRTKNFYYGMAYVAYAF